MKTRNILLYTIASLCACVALSCKETAGKKYTDTISSGVISISVDESFAPIIDQEIAAFENIYTQAAIIPLYHSEVEALNLLIQDSVRMAIATRDLTDGERAALEQKKLFAKSEKIATDAIALIINRENPDSLLTTAQLKQILSGEITSWKQINPRSRLGDISFVFDNPNSGTLRYLRDTLSAGRALSDKLFAQKDNRDVIDYVTQTPGALGVVGFSWVYDASDTTRLSFDPKIRVMGVTDQAEPHSYNANKPYQYYLATGEYPLARDVYAITTDSHNGLATGFTTFLASFRGQRIILRAGLLPATQSLRLVNVRENI